MEMELFISDACTQRQKADLKVLVVEAKLNYFRHSFAPIKLS